MTDFRNANVALKATGKTSAAPGAWPITFPNPPAAMKGLCNGMKTQTDLDHQAIMGADWFYTWGPTPNLATSQNMPWQGQAFVPMMWSATDTRLAAIPSILAAPATPDHLLAFNEPDHASQANMTVDEALAAWPQLEAMGLRLGAPATVSPNNAWLQDFMTRAQAAGHRVDFIPVHIYQNTSVNTLLSKIDALWAAYGLPVWITEFAVADWSVSSTGPLSTRYTRDQVNAFLAAVVPELRKRPWLERFAWHTRTASDPQTWFSALYNDDGTLTSTGALYRDL
jgi:hypothetical protein